MNHFLVTGAAGFIGSNIVEKLLKDGHKVTGLDNLSTGTLKNLYFTENHKNNWKFIEGDVLDRSLVLNLSKNIDFIIHLAAKISVPESLEKIEDYNHTNIVGTLNMLDAAKTNKIKRFVLASSSAIYGDEPYTPKHENLLPKPLSPYAVNKLSGEYYCKIYNDFYHVPTVCLRYFNIYGPRQNPNSAYAAVIPKFITAYLNNISPTIFGDGEQTRDFIFIEDIVKANIAACFASSNAFGQVINIGSSIETSINDLSDIISKESKSKLKPIYKEERSGDVKNSVADTSKMQSILGIHGTTPLDIGIKQTISYFKEKI